MFAPTSFMLGASVNGKRLSGDGPDLDEILRRQNSKNEHLERNIILRILDFIISNIYLFSILVYGCWIFCGLVWYKYYSNWTWATAYYYTIEAGLSIGFCYPAEKEDGSKLFTIFYVLIGSSVVSGCLGLLAQSMVSTKVSLVAVKHGLGAMSHKDEDDRITFSSICKWIWYHMKYLSGWYTNRSRTIIISVFVFWMGLGTAYGMVVEKWSFITSLYWAITSSSTGGLQSAPCESGDEFTCNMGNMRGSLMGVFMMVGVPLYAAAIGQFAHIAVGRAMAAQEEKMLSRPIEDAEFIFAANILSPEGSQTLVLGEYILLELMRLGQTNQQQIEALKRRFSQLDKDKRGELDIWDLQQSGRVVPRKLHSIELARRLRSRSIELFSGSPIKIRRSASKEMFTFVAPPAASFEVTSAEVELANDRRVHALKTFKKSKSIANGYNSTSQDDQPQMDRNSVDVDSHAKTVSNMGPINIISHDDATFEDFDFNGDDFNYDDAAMYDSPSSTNKVSQRKLQLEEDRIESMINPAKEQLTKLALRSRSEERHNIQARIGHGDEEQGLATRGRTDDDYQAAPRVEDDEEDYIPNEYLNSLSSEHPPEI